jgi:hypothetical protein
LAFTSSSLFLWREFSWGAFLFTHALVLTAVVSLLLPRPPFFFASDSDSTAEGCLRVGLADVDDVTEGTLVPFGCPEHEYNPAASLFVPSGEHIVKSLFARG